MYFMFCKNLYSIWSPSFLIIGIDNISVTYLSGSCFFLCQWKIKHDLTCGCFLPSKDSGQAIPRVVESCIRFINLYGELLVVVTSLKSDREWILISQVCDFVEKWHYISFTDRQTDRQIGSLARHERWLKRFVWMNEFVHCMQTLGIHEGSLGVVMVAQQRAVKKRWKADQF